MSQATEWFIASASEAHTLGTALELAGSPRLLIPGILLLELSDLHEILLGTALSPKALYQARDRSVVVFELPTSFLKALGELAGRDGGGLAQRWQRQSEHLADWPAAELTAQLSKMTDFARRAQSEGKSVLDLSTV